jgi:hypothetical protein
MAFEQPGGAPWQARRGLARLMLRWPAWRAALRQWGLQDARLCDLVEDYEAACAALAYWAHAPILFAPVRMKEYRSLVSALEEDIEAVRAEAIDRTPEGRNWTVTTVIPRPPLRWNKCRVVERTLLPWQDRFDLDPKS